MFGLLWFSHTLLGQVSFSHSAGGAYYLTSSIGAPAITYSPRLNLLQMSDEATLSLGTHIGLGLVYNSRAGASSFALDLPIVAELNLGHASSPESDAVFGGFIGAGYGINKMGAAGAFGGETNDAAGIVLNGGIRANIRESFPLGLRVSYLINTKEGNEDVIGVGIFYNFGNF